MSLGKKSDAGPMYTDMLEYICDVSQSCLSINRRYAPYKICDIIKWGQPEWKVVLLSMQNMGKGLHKVFKSVVNEIL